MTHLRTEISDKFVTSLTDLSTTSDNVFFEEEYAIEALPAVNIILGRESVEIISLVPRHYERKLNIIVQCYAQTAAQREQVTKEVEIAIANMDISDIAQEVTLISLDSETAKGEDQNSINTLTYEVTYTTLNTQPAELG